MDPEPNRASSSGMPLRILIVHNRYRLSGGEDTVVATELWTRGGRVLRSQRLAFRGWRFSERDLVVPYNAAFAECSPEIPTQRRTLPQPLLSDNAVGLLAVLLAGDSGRADFAQFSLRLCECATESRGRAV